MVHAVYVEKNGHKAVGCLDKKISGERNSYARNNNNN